MSIRKERKMGARREVLERIGQLSLTGDNRSASKSKPANRNTTIVEVPAPAPDAGMVAATANVHRIDRAMRGLAPLPLERESVALAEAWIETALEHASQTLRRMAGGKYDRPAGLHSAWPSYLHDPWDYPADKTETPSDLPGSADIDEMDRVLPWLAWIEDDRVRALVWGRARRISVKSLQRKYGLSRQHIRRLQCQGFAIIMARLTGHPVERLREILR
jgi:hypothetical protein